MEEAGRSALKKQALSYFFDSFLLLLFHRGARLGLEKTDCNIGRTKNWVL